MGVTADKLIAFARTMVGTKLTTLAREYQFVLTAAGHDYIEYRPTRRKAKPRRQQRSYVTRVCDEFNRSRSFRPGAYREVTRNASYILPLIKLYLEGKETRARRRPDSAVEAVARRNA